MTLREAISFGFQKVTVTTQMSGDKSLFHYFVQRINGVDFMLCNDEKEWFGQVLTESHLRFKDYETFSTLIGAINLGHNAEI